MEKSAIFAANIEALDEFMKIIGFISVDVDDPFEDERKYVKDYWDKTSTLVLKKSLVNDDKTFSKSFKKMIMIKVSYL